MANLAERTLRAKKLKEKTIVIGEDDLYKLLLDRDPSLREVTESFLVDFVYKNSLCVLCSDGTKVGEYEEEVVQLEEKEQSVEVATMDELDFLDLEIESIRITEDMSFREIFLSVTGTWKALFHSLVPLAQDIEEAVYTKNLSLLKDNSPWTQRSFFPERTDILRAFMLTPLDCLNVVILGQDPYPTLGTDCRPRATGLSFSVRIGECIPPSLINIFRELEATVPSFTMPSHGNLDSWARQGILLLNTALTVFPEMPASHSAIWKGFTKATIQYISEKRPGTIFVLWGSHARVYTKLIGKKCKVLEAGHPSTMNTRGGFRGCNHFNIINNELLRLGKPPIQWNLED